MVRRILLVCLSFSVLSTVTGCYTSAQYNDDGSWARSRQAIRDEWRLTHPHEPINNYADN